MVHEAVRVAKEQRNQDHGEGHQFWTSGGECRREINPTYPTGTVVGGLDALLTGVRAKSGKQTR